VLPETLSENKKKRLNCEHILFSEREGRRGKTIFMADGGSRENNNKVVSH
jgi:hypothetical protein